MKYMKYRVRVTKKGFGKKAFAKVADECDFKLYNVFGFALWIERRK